MEVPLSTCFATLRKGVDSNNANDGYGKMGVVLGWQNCSPDSIQDLEYHIPLFSKAGGQLEQLFARFSAGTHSQVLRQNFACQVGLCQAKNLVIGTS